MNTPTPGLAKALGEVPRGVTSTLLVRKVNADDHALFKAECAKRGRTMRGAIIAMMKDARAGKVINLARLLNTYPEPK